MDVPALPSIMRKEVYCMDCSELIASVIAGVIANFLYVIICKW